MFILSIIEFSIHLWGKLIWQFWNLRLNWIYHSHCNKRSWNKIGPEEVLSLRIVLTPKYCIQNIADINVRFFETKCYVYLLDANFLTIEGNNFVLNFYQLHSNNTIITLTLWRWWKAIFVDEWKFRLKSIWITMWHTKISMWAILKKLLLSHQ